MSYFAAQKIIAMLVGTVAHTKETGCTPIVSFFILSQRHSACHLSYNLKVWNRNNRRVKRRHSSDQTKGGHIVSPTLYICMFFPPPLLVFMLSHRKNVFSFVGLLEYEWG